MIPYFFKLFTVLSQGFASCALLILSFVFTCDVRTHLRFA